VPQALAEADTLALSEGVTVPVVLAVPVVESVGETVTVSLSVLVPEVEGLGLDETDDVADCEEVGDRLLLDDAEELGNTVNGSAGGHRPERSARERRGDVEQRPGSISAAPNSRTCNGKTKHGRRPSFDAEDPEALAQAEQISGTAPNESVGSETTHNVDHGGGVLSHAATVLQVLPPECRQ
jgi:hypothetical protein